ncbi:MAG: transcriptional repressor LexA [Sedimentisphaerales bacterium]|nr:transcriptional repressor LexA [Sedimentisphaerales bacterium]
MSPAKRKVPPQPDVLTPRQVEILRLIGRYRSKNGCSPTLQEIARRLNLSRVTIFGHVEALVQKGLLGRLPNKARSLTLKPAAASLVGSVTVTDGGKTSKERNLSLTHAELSGQISFPLAGTIAAGLPLEAVENPDQIDLAQLFDSSQESFALKVRGESMIDEQIRDGDYVIVKKTNNARDGQTVVALLENGEATLKKLFREKSGYRLEAANPDFDPIHTDNLQIQGVVVGVIRQY